MVLSIETTLIHPRRGFIKLEDTLAVTEDGYDAFGEIHGPRQAEVVEALPEILRDNGCNAVLTAVGA